MDFVKVKKALSDEEWVSGPKESIGYPVKVVYSSGGNLVVDGSFSGNEAHALAAFCLRDQPFGFTWVDVDSLREIEHELNEWIEGYATEGATDYVELPQYKRLQAVKKLADRIEALLPPRTA